MITDEVLKTEKLLVTLLLCAQNVLKCLFWERIGRLDISWTVNTLSRVVTMWNQACDRRLENIFSHIWSTKANPQHCFVCDSLEDSKLALFHDASFASDLHSKFTSWCKKWSAVSHSCAEAAVFSLDAGVHLGGLLVVPKFGAAGHRWPHAIADALANSIDCGKTFC